MFPDDKDLKEGLTLTFPAASYVQVAKALQRGERPRYKAVCEGVPYEAEFDAAIPNSALLHLRILSVNGKPVERA